MRQSQNANQIHVPKQPQVAKDHFKCNWSVSQSVGQLPAGTECRVNKQTTKSIKSLMQTAIFFILVWLVQASGIPMLIQRLGQVNCSRSLPISVLRFDNKIKVLNKILKIDNEAIAKKDRALRENGRRTRSVAQRLFNIVLSTLQNFELGQK